MTFAPQRAIQDVCDGEVRKRAGDLCRCARSDERMGNRRTRARPDNEARPDSDYAQAKPDFLSGNWRTRIPLAAKIALQIAGGVGGKAGSPNPVGLNLVGRK